MNSTGNDNDACTDIAVLSRVCSKEGYQSQRRYQNADDIVGQVSRVVVRSLTPHSSFAAFRRPPARCKAAIQTLSCSLVFPQCRIDSSATQPLPHYSVLLNGVANACGMGVDNLSGRLLATLSQRQDERALTRHWRTPLARISENWNWAQDKPSDRMPLVRRIAGPLHNPRRDFAHLPPIPPNRRPLRTYGAKSGNGVRQPLAELLVINSPSSTKTSDSLSSAVRESNATGDRSGELQSMARNSQINSVATPADSLIVELLQPSSPEEKKKRAAPEEDELGQVIQGIRRRYPAMDAEPHLGRVVHTTVADELDMLPAKRQRQSAQ
ncbi:hypothetical protein GGI20_001998 [Coemansia sp. BCRC 34301]|nr:hypothetical protein GGI20_001998 [Coemansia sp. BCRC 34301]